MKHVSILKLKRNDGLSLAEKSLVARATGSFYTPPLISEFLNDKLLPLLSTRPRRTVSIIDPFCGDGRLVCWLIERAQREGINKRWHVDLWDMDPFALEHARQRILALPANLRARIDVKYWIGDAFSHAENAKKYDIVITNPPWDVLKPDRRELDQLSDADCASYIHSLKALDRRLATSFPNSQPTRKFAGWGTNLSRVGAELAVNLLVDDGILGIVLPASVFADQMSLQLRQWMLSRINLHDVGYFPAEARLFSKVDQSSIAMVAECACVDTHRFGLHSYSTNQAYSSQSFELSMDSWSRREFCIPFTLERATYEIFETLSKLPTWSDLEQLKFGMWSGRELDETRIAGKFSPDGSHHFLKGRMVGRFKLIEPAIDKIDASQTKIPRSADMYRIAWRDVSRPTQNRRMHATIIQPGYVTGNSLNIALFESQAEQSTFAMLGIINSMVFEAQIRMRSTTSHISLGVVRGVHLPDIRNSHLIKRLAELVKQCMKDPNKHEPAIEVAVAKSYGLKKMQFAGLMKSFPNLAPDYQKLLLAMY